jgi:hypothetical protein
MCFLRKFHATSKKKSKMYRLMVWKKLFRELFFFFGNTKKNLHQWTHFFFILCYLLISGITQLYREFYRINKENLFWMEFVIGFVGFFKLFGETSAS